MNGTAVCETFAMRSSTDRPGDVTELVRGSERRLIEEMTPVVRRQTVSLDMKSVERIDAAGIAALITLYRIAHESGHEFTVSNPSERVREMLALVGLDEILASHNANANSYSGSGLARTAA